MILKEFSRAALVLIVVAGCGPGLAPGLGPEDGGGDAGDELDSGEPADAGEGSDAGEDTDAGGERDAGHHADAGSHRDAGPRPDAGETTPDAGSAVTFAEVYAVFQNYCTNCHTSTGLYSYLDLSTPAAACAHLINVAASGPACGMTGEILVKPGDPTHSLLYTKVHATQDCGSRMPRGFEITQPPPLPAADQQIIHNWIAEGAPGPG